MKFIINNIHRFVEALTLLVPILLLRLTPNYYLEPEILKNVIYSWLLILAAGTLLPALYQAYAPGSKFQQEQLIARIAYYLKILICFAVLIIFFKLLKASLLPISFTILMFTVFWKFLSTKSKIENHSLGKQIFTQWIYLYSLSFLSFFLYQNILPTPALFLSFSVSLLMLGVRLQPIYSRIPLPQNLYLRIPAISYLSHAAMQGLMIILQLIHPWHFLVFFFVPLIVKISPNSELQLEDQQIYKLRLNNFFIFVIFLGIMLFSYLYPEG